MLCDQLKCPQDQLQARFEITKYLCTWTIQHKFFKHLIQYDLHPLEVDVILKFLYERSLKDIEDTICPSANVNTLVGFLVHLHRVKEAEEIHLEHQVAVENSGMAVRL